MRARSDARKQLVKEAEIEKLRAKKVAQSAKQASSSEPELKKHMGRGKKLLLSVVSFFVAIVAVLVMVTTMGTTGAARVYPASVDGSAVVDPATIAVRFTVHNNGSQPVSPACTINLQNASGSYHGFNVFYMNPIAPGAVTHAKGNITITSQGAQYVTQSTINCTAKTSDASVSTGKSVKVISVFKPLGAYDSSTGWYWGGPPMVSGVAANAQMTCTETAFNVSGKVIATHKFHGVTLNDGKTVIGYGNGEDSTSNTTKAIAQAIKSVTAKCTLA